MVSSFSPRGSKLLQGALEVYNSDTSGVPPVMIPFQYNPFQIRRTLAHRFPKQEGGGGGAPEDIRRVAGPPIETITLTIELDATDQPSSQGSSTSVPGSGLHPAIAALEMLLYPPSIQFQQNKDLAEQGEIQISPAALPLTFLVWGKPRVVPVHVKSFSITEEEFDPNLNPVRARIELSLQVLTYMELLGNSTGVDTFVAYQKQKEEFARQNRSTNSSDTRTVGLLPA